MDWLRRTRTVAAPDGRSWTVQREVLPRMDRVHVQAWKRWRDSGPSADAGAWLDGLGSALDVPAIVGIVFVVALVFVVLAPVLALALDLVVAVAAAGAGLAGRLLFRRPWRIEATSATTPPERHAWAVVGTSASADAVDAVARDLAAGVAAAALNPGPPLTPRPDAGASGPIP